jgi:hypothetical protein
MKKLLFLLILISSYCARAQYDPTQATVSNKPYGGAQGFPTDARTWFYDASLFIWRPYQSTAEVLAYLNQPRYRSGRFPIGVNVGGTLEVNGTFTGGLYVEYWFKDGVADADLVVKLTSRFGLEDISSDLDRHVNLHDKNFSLLNGHSMWFVSGTDSTMSGAFGEIYMSSGVAIATFDAPHRNYNTIASEAHRIEVKMASIGDEALASILHIDTTRIRLETYDHATSGTHYGSHLDLANNGDNIKFRWDSGSVTRTTAYLPHAYGSFYLPLTVNSLPADQWGNINLGAIGRFAVPGEDDFATDNRTFKLHGHTLQLNPDAGDTTGINTYVQFREDFPFNAYWRDPDNLYVANLSLGHDAFNAVIGDAGGVNGSVISAQRHEIDLRTVTSTGLALFQIDASAYPAQPIVKVIYNNDGGFVNSQSFARNVNGNYTIPLTVNSIAANATGNITIPYADSALGATGLVSDTTQYFRGEKGIVSYSDLLFEAYSGGTLRTILGSGGGQTWFLNDGSAEVGRVKYTTPVGTPGIGFYNTSGTGRSQIRQYASTGGFAMGSEAGSASFAGNQLVQLPNGHLYVQQAGAGNVTELNYLFNVGGNAKVDDVVMLPHYANNSTEDSVLATDNTGLVKNKLATPIVTITSSASFASYNNLNASYIIYNNAGSGPPSDDVKNNLSAGIYKWDASTGDFNGLTGKWKLVAVAPNLELSGTTKTYWHTPALQVWKNYAEGDATHPPTFISLRSDVGDLGNGNYLNGAMISGNGYGGAIVFHTGGSSTRRLRLGLIDNNGLFYDGMEVHYSSGGNTLINSMPMVPNASGNQSVGSSTLPFGSANFGGLSLGYVAKTSAYTTTATNYTVGGDATSAAFTVTLGTLTASTVQVVIKTDASANAVTVGGTINGATNYSLTARYQFVVLQNIGSNNWLIIGKN